MKYYLPIHLDGGNRGCEAITKATSLLLAKENIYALSRDVNLDKFLGIDKYCTLHADKKSLLLLDYLESLHVYLVTILSHLHIGIITSNLYLRCQIMA